MNMHESYRQLRTMGTIALGRSGFGDAVYARAGVAQAQVPADIEAQLVKIGHIVDPACTAKLYRPLMPANDIHSNATPLYPGVVIARDISFGPNTKDVVDVFMGRERRRVAYRADVPSGRRGQQDRAAEPRSQRFHGQHRTLGREERNDGRASCSAIRARTGTIPAATFRRWSSGRRTTSPSTRAIPTVCSCGRNRPATALSESISDVPNCGDRKASA